MKLEERIHALSEWGKAMGREIGERDSVFGHEKERAFHQNGWFDGQSVDQALEGIAFMLNAEKLEEWASKYDLIGIKPKKVGIIMAGNLPLVGMHDLVSSLLVGHTAVIKLSSDDSILMPAALEILRNVSTESFHQVEIVQGKMPQTDALMATGSKNTSRYFEFYFKDRASIIRKGRNGLAVLDGSETEEELTELGKDLFSFYGLGCRNVSKLLVPEDYDLPRIFKAIVDHRNVIDHHKYFNNYGYNRTIYLMNEDDFLDNGFFMLKKDDAIASPVASLHYQTYKSDDELLDIIQEHKEDIQCIVGHGNIPFGRSQFPEPWDYADGVDTVEFLTLL